MKKEVIKSISEITIIQNSFFLKCSIFFILILNSLKVNFEDKYLDKPTDLQSLPQVLRSTLVVIILHFFKRKHSPEKLKTFHLQSIFI